MYINRASCFIDKITILLNGEPVPNNTFESWDEANDELGYVVINKHDKFERIEGSVKFIFNEDELSEPKMRRVIEKYG